MEQTKEILPDVVMPQPDTIKILAGQKALVTGANSGIGEGIAIELAKAGCDVAVNYVTNPDEANAVVSKIIKYGVKAVAIIWISVFGAKSASGG